MEKSIKIFWVFWPEGEKLQWFQSQLDPEKTSYTRKDACDIIERSNLFIYYCAVALFHV